MIDPQIAAHIEVIQAPDRMAVSAHVAGEPARPLRWRLEATARSAGGTSSVAQAGVYARPQEGPVGTVSVTPGSQGSAVLTVYDGDHEVARDQVTFEADQSPEASPHSGS